MSLTNAQIEKRLNDYEKRFNAIVDLLEELKVEKSDFRGGQILTLTQANELKISFYMVTGFRIDDPYIVFYHLVPADENITNWGIESFPPKPDEQSNHKYILDLEKNARWTKIYERFFIPNVERTQFLGHFTYSVLSEIVDIKFRVNRESSIVDFKKT